MERVMEYVVDEKLAGLHRRLTAAELEQLENNCVQDGRIIDPIIVWDNYVLDGVHRLKIAEKHGLEYGVVGVELANMEEAVLWVINHQLGKRNISDFEAQRLRAEQARIIGDTGVVAEQHGVSRRTVQRDLEADAAMQLMSEDIRARCENGTIISYRSDWKRYAELTDSQRAAVDETLRRNPTLRLGQAIPRDEVRLTPDDFAVINDSCLSAQQKQSLSLGTLYADSDSVRRFNQLAPDEQQFVVDILDDPEIDDLGDAILTLRRGFSPRAPEEGRREERVRKNMEKAIDKIESLLDDMQSLNNNHSCYMACKEALSKLTETWATWR